MKKTEPYVFVGQAGGFWRLTLDQWEEVCRAGLKGGYDLSPYRRIRSKPIWLEKYPDNSGYRRTRTDMLYFEPEGWSKEDFREALDEIEKMRLDGDAQG